MARILRPVFGQPCYECGEQVPMARVRILEQDAIAAHGHRLLKMNIRCLDCGQLRENEERRARRAERGRDITIIRG